MMTQGPSEPPWASQPQDAPPPPAPPPPPPQPLEYGGYLLPWEPPKPKGMATASLVLGICSVTICIIPYLGWCAAPICGILAIVFGLVARRAADHGEADGRGMATAGLVCGIVCISLFAIILLIGLLGLGFGMMSAPPNAPASNF